MPRAWRSSAYAACVHGRRSRWRGAVVLGLTLVARDAGRRRRRARCCCGCWPPRDRSASSCPVQVVLRGVEGHAVARHRLRLRAADRLRPGRGDPALVVGALARRPVVERKLAAARRCSTSASTRSRWSCRRSDRRAHRRPARAAGRLPGRGPAARSCSCGACSSGQRVASSPLALRAGCPSAHLRPDLLLQLVDGGLRARLRAADRDRRRVLGRGAAAARAAADRHRAQHPPGAASTSTRRCTTRSPASRTARCSPTASRRRSRRARRDATASARDGHGPRPLQGDQRHPRPLPRRPPAAARRRAAERRRCARRTPWPGSAATSSRCCCRRRPSDDHAARGRAASCSTALSRSFEIDGLTLEVGASVGIACFPAHGEDGETLLQRADIAMYVAKNAGTPARALYETEQDQHSVQRLALAGELRRAIEGDELVLHYQPKIDVATGRVIGAEALCRWQHPSLGLIMPGDFVPMAEHTGLITPLTHQVLDLALAQIATWARAGQPPERRRQPLGPVVPGLPAARGGAAAAARRARDRPGAASSSRSRSR